MRAHCTRRSSRGLWGIVASAMVATLVAFALGCAPSEVFDGTLYRGQHASFRVASVPAGWKRVSLTAADLAFRDSSHEGSVLINSRCTTADRDAPLLSLTEHLIIGTTDRHVAREETLAFDSREARHTVLQARLDGVPMAFDIYVLKKDGCVYDLVYIAPPEVASTGQPAFEQFVQGFHTVPSAG